VSESVHAMLNGRPINKIAWIGNGVKGTGCGVLAIWRSIPTFRDGRSKTNKTSEYSVSPLITKPTVPPGTNHKVAVEINELGVGICFFSFYQVICCSRRMDGRFPIGTTAGLPPDTVIQGLLSVYDISWPENFNP
jgi:hypothetical protein